MNKIKIINAIKGVFSALGAKTSDSNYAVALLDKTSAEPKGMMDFANLASVLGVAISVAGPTKDGFAEIIETAFQATQTYSSFEGKTQSLSEGRFWGYKHNSNVGEAILLTRVYMLTGNLFLFTRNSDGSWSCKRII